ncbi:MAG: hypothetical protein M3N45_12835 [Actinomycetota bacterium]|nr:hypothetical protein [Actinomycetota bacterium]
MAHHRKAASAPTRDGTSRSVGWTGRTRRTAALGAILVSLLVAGCGGLTGESGGSAQAGTERAYSPKIDPADFVREIDNEYFPMKLGTTFVYEGGGEHGEMTVTSDTKNVMGVDCVVVDDRAWEGGELIEQTDDWFAQDKRGNVWYFGEDTQEYKNGKITSIAGSWEAGVDGAKPGIIMPADPKVGESYRQEYYPGEAMDMARVIGLNEPVTVPYGSFDNALETKEWTPLQPSFSEKKYYVRGVGPLGNPADLALVDVRHK